jgi:dTDP-4-amino-4,6-dideoxygalactose transaminase
VHLYGQVPDVDGIGGVADRAGIALIEDAAQAHGAEWSGRRAGSLGRAAAFSFYPGKNLGAFGDGGAVVTSDPGLAATVRSLANHGRAAGSRHVHDLAGGNSRLDGLQAAILSIKLGRLDDWNGRRRDASARYRKLLDGSPCRLTETDPRATVVHHLEVVRVCDRATVVAELDRRSIGWGLHYPVPAHRQPPFARFSAAALPVAEQAAGEIVSLPMYPTISTDEIDAVCDAVRSATDRSSP